MDEFESEFKLVRDNLKQMKEELEKFIKLCHTKGRTHKDTISKFVAFLDHFHVLTTFKNFIVTKYEYL